MPRAWRGEIWFVYTPGQPDDPHQPRPALVISEDDRNRTRDSLIVVPIFSRGRVGPTRVSLQVGMGDIAHDSILFCDEVSTLSDRFIADGPLGPQVSEHVLQEVVCGVRRALGEVVREL